MSASTASPRHGQMRPAAKRSTRGVMAIVIAVALTILGVYATPAPADYEQVTEHFGLSGEGEELQLASAIAINTSGAGGIEPGSIYVVGRNDRVVRYGPGGEGEEPPFKEAWGWGVGDEKEEYERCGPALVTEPAQHTFHTCTRPPGLGRFGGEQVGHFAEPDAIAIDGATGDVYVRNTMERERVRHVIEVFTATGQSVGEGFGEQGRSSPAPGESIAESPQKLHEHGFWEALAVSDTGTVYVSDVDFNDISDPPGDARIMSFVPEHAGDYEHYVYSGEENDITAPTKSIQLFGKLALVGQNRLVAANETSIIEYAPGSGSTPLCSLVPGTQIFGVTANAVTGEVFYYSSTGQVIHRLGPCDPGTGKFTELQAPLSINPAAEAVRALAVNPSAIWGPLRPEGVLYAVDRNEHTDVTPAEHGVGDLFAPSKVFPPAVVAESVVDTTVDSTVLRAELNPNGFTTSYRFQYVPSATYAVRKKQAESEGKTTEEAVEAAFAGAAEVPVDGGRLAGAVAGVAEAGVGGLDPETEYRFRVVASSECEGEAQPACSVKGAVASFSTYATVPQGPVDGRSYELVSPPDKNGGEVFPADSEIGSCGGECKPSSSGTLARFPMQSAPDGTSLAYMGDSFSAIEGDNSNEYLSKRTTTGWQTVDLSPALQNQTGSGSVVFNTDFGRDLIYQGEPPQLVEGAPADYQNLYLQDTNASRELTPLIAEQPRDRSADSFVLEFAGASPELSRAFFSANDALTQETPFAPEPADPGRFGHDLYEWHEGALSLVNILPGNTEVAEGSAFASEQRSLSPDAHTVSSDGSRVFWSVAGRLYVRVNGQETLEVADGSFLDASADGLQVLLADGRLYEFNEETDSYEQEQDLTQGQGGFEGVLGTGEESGQLSHIYFVDTVTLAGAGENERGQSAKSGEDNLYEWDAGLLHYVTTLDGSDDGGPAAAIKDWSSSTVYRTAEASPDGRWLAFMSTARLTGHDNGGPCEDVPGGGHLAIPCSEVFLYDASTGGLSCVSCNPTGEAPRGPSTLRVIWGAHPWFAQSRYLTDSGRLVFDSGDRLSAADTNGRVEDVYEYEPTGVGSCSRSAGCVSLVSSGSGSVDSNFLAMDESGANVFFTTRERLVPQDKDELVDVYDAREHGGFPAQTETQRTECQGEACQATPTPPSFTMPGSVTFFGAGNLIQQLPIAASKPSKATRGQKVRSEALEKCRRQRAKRRRTACERRARKAGVKARGVQSRKKGGAR